MGYIIKDFIITDYITVGNISIYVTSRKYVVEIEL